MDLHVWTRGRSHSSSSGLEGVSSLTDLFSLSNQKVETMAARHLVLFSCVCCLVLSATLAVTDLEEDRLMTYLTSAAAHPLARPVKDVKDAVVVDLSIFLRTLELDEKAETLYTSNWYRYEWKDHYLAWDPANFSGIQSVRIPINNIWNPDIAVYNSKEETKQHDTRAILHSDGTISYVPRVHTATSCNVDLSYFPFDTQKCILYMGSWSYDGGKVNLTMYQKELDTSLFTPDKAWKLVKTTAKRYVYTPEWAPNNPYIYLIYSITLKRASSYFTYVYVGPVAILSFLAAAIFILPPANTQKMTLGGALLICYGLFFMEVSYMLPPVHASTPLIDKYYMAMYCLLGISVFLSAVVTNLAKRTWTHGQPPEIFKKVMLGCLARCLCINYNPDDNFPHGGQELSDVKAENTSEPGRYHVSQSGQTREWLVFASVFDRLCLIAYVLLTVLLTFSIMISYK